VVTQPTTPKLEEICLRREIVELTPELRQFIAAILATAARHFLLLECMETMR